ncbi:MAG TPA: Rid family detoxifying hydrolase, partial [Deltaproteobacteria bacterium]|nr:Rid family detoxifying hydrolase [Deltaproteobacteria bacterium]
LDPVSGELETGDAGSQTARVMNNIKAVLAATGAGLGDIVKTTIYLVDMDDFAAVNQVYGSFLGDHRPARSTVAVKGLPKGAKVEIEVIALL